MTRTLASMALFTLVACNRPATTQTPSPVATPSATPTVQVQVPDAVVALVAGKPITLAEVDRLAASKLHEIREQVLENLILTQVIEPMAKAAGQSPQDFVRVQVEKKVPDVSEAEAQAWLEKNQSRLPPQVQGKKFEEIKSMAIPFVTMNKRQEAIPEVLAELKAKAGVKVLLAPPKVAVEAVGPSKGPATAKVTIVEFSDFQCPYCSKAKETVDQVVAAYGDKVRVVFRDFPLDFHQNAQKAAEAGQCANEQGKFWEMHDWMFANQKSLSVDDLKKAARDLKLKGEDFDKCLTSGKHAETVAANLRAGKQAGVEGTPAFFVNGTFLNGAQPFERFKTEIDRALAQ